MYLNKYHIPLFFLALCFVSVSVSEVNAQLFRGRFAGRFNGPIRQRCQQCQNQLCLNCWNQCDERCKSKYGNGTYDYHRCLRNCDQANMQCRAQRPRLRTCFCRMDRPNRCCNSCCGNQRSVCGSLSVQQEVKRSECEDVFERCRDDNDCGCFGGCLTYCECVRDRCNEVHSQPCGCMGIEN